jgi:hypothetical protein
MTHTAETISVKPLEWTPVPRSYAGLAYRADSIVGEYVANKHVAYFQGNLICTGREIADSKAACQSHFEATIRSVLVASSVTPEAVESEREDFNVWWTTTGRQQSYDSVITRQAAYIAWQHRASTPPPQPAPQADLVEALGVSWTRFCDANPNDLTSPEDLPDHALMTCTQFVEYACQAIAALSAMPVQEGWRDETAEELVRSAHAILNRLTAHAPDVGVDEFLDALNDARFLIARIDGAE